MPAMYADITLRCSPRNFVQQALHKGAPEAEKDLWRCVQCGNCTAVCPEGVDPAGLIRLWRADAREKTEEERLCANCGREILSLSASSWLRRILPKPEMTGLEPEDASGQDFPGLKLCPVCRRLAFADTICAGAEK
jgi:Fe-S oxidoreductase